MPGYAGLCCTIHLYSNDVVYLCWFMIVYFSEQNTPIDSSILSPKDRETESTNSIHEQEIANSSADDLFNITSGSESFISLESVR